MDFSTVALVLHALTACCSDFLLAWAQVPLLGLLEMIAKGGLTENTNILEAAREVISKCR